MHNKGYLRFTLSFIAGFLFVSYLNSNNNIFNKIGWTDSVKKISSASSPFANRQEYKNLLALQESFIKNAKAVKPLVVSINNLEEQAESSDTPVQEEPVEKGADDSQSSLENEKELKVEWQQVCCKVTDR